MINIKTRTFASNKKTGKTRDSNEIYSHLVNVQESYAFEKRCATRRGRVVDFVILFFAILQ